ncbi:MAG: HlyD family secretion protein [Novosphingobium sp.]
MVYRRTIALILAALTAGCERAEGSSGPAPLDSSKPGYLTTAVGRIDSAGEARMLVASADGVIARLHVERGDRVKAGQVLLEVDCRPRAFAAGAMRAEGERAGAAAATVAQGNRTQQIEAARQAVRLAEANRAEAADRLAMAQALVDKGFFSRRDLAARENAFAGADAAWRSAQAESALVAEGPRASERREARAAARAARGQAMAAMAEAAQCSLKSPIGGEVLQILRREGEFSGASQGTPLIVVGDLSHLIVRAEIAERDAARVVPGQRAEVWIEGEPQRWHGTVRQLASVMGRRSARSLDPTDRFDRDVREVFIALDGTPPPALVGLRVTVGVLK